MSSPARRYLGIFVSDQGAGQSASVALALIDGTTLEYARFLTIGDGKKEGSDLRTLQREFRRVLRDLEPDVVVLRGKDMRRGPWEKVRKCVHAEGVLIAAAAEAHIDCLVETGSSIRRTVGSKTSTAVTNLIANLRPAPTDWAIGEAAAAAVAEARQRP